MRTGRPRKVVLEHPNKGASSLIAGAPTCPRDLDAAAKRKWKAVVKLMTDAGTITQLDVDLLAMYCEAFARRADALKQLGGEYVLHGEKGSYQNPMLHVANKAMDQMVKLSKQLGLDKLTARKLGVDGRPAKQQGVKARDRSKGPPPPLEAIG